MFRYIQYRSNMNGHETGF